MCGVIAFKGDYSAQAGTIERLFEQSRARGWHAFGAAWQGASLSSDTLEPVLTKLREAQPSLFIGHCRYSTSGFSHQPIVRGETALVFNGVIDMGLKHELEARWNVVLETDNDGEVFLARSDKLALLERIEVSFAGAWLRGSSVQYARNANRPLYRVDTDGATFICSTLDIARRSGLGGAKLVEPLRFYAL